jgi:hypothetical protein
MVSFALSAATKLYTCSCMSSAMLCTGNEGARVSGKLTRKIRRISESRRPYYSYLQLFATSNFFFEEQVELLHAVPAQTHTSAHQQVALPMQRVKLVLNGIIPTDQAVQEGKVRLGFKN